MISSSQKFTLNIWSFTERSRAIILVGGKPNQNLAKTIILVGGHLARFLYPPQHIWQRFVHSRTTSNHHLNVSCLLTRRQNQAGLITGTRSGLANHQIPQNVSYQVGNRKIILFWSLIMLTSSSDLGPLTLLGKSTKWDPKNLIKSSKLHLSLQKRVSCWVLGIFGFAQIR